MKFTTKDELILQAIKDGACDKGIKFANSCKDLHEIIETIDDEMRLWCLIHGYKQFADRCDLSKLSSYSWRQLLSYQPQFADYYDWSKLDGWDWSVLLRRHPQFADRCDWSKLSGYSWRMLLRYQPQFAERCDWSKLSGFQWRLLLRDQPQFASYRK